MHSETGTSGHTYCEAGTGGHAKSTIDGKASAMNHYTAFLLSKGINYSECGEDVLCDESTLRQFGTYLITEAKCEKTSFRLRRDSANQYFRGVVNTLHKRNKVFDQHETWNTEVRTDMAKLIMRRCIADGTIVKNKYKGVGRLTLIEIGKSLLSTGTVKSIGTRAILNTSYHGVGRGGEVGQLTWSNLYWDFNEELLASRWNQQ